MSRQDAHNATSSAAHLTGESCHDSVPLNCHARSRRWASRLFWFNRYYLSWVSAPHAEVLLFRQKDPKPFPPAHGPAVLLRPSPESHGCGTRFSQTVLAETSIRRWDSATRKAEHTESFLLLCIHRTPKSNR